MKLNNSKNEFTIGILGGMGTYATIHLFQQYAELFPAEKEWERPRIIIDNNCVMPSRVRAILYNENVELLVNSMAASISFLLLGGGVNRIILGCNTSHLFLNDVYKIVPEAKNVVVNIIDECVNELVKQGVKEVYLLATEGTIISNIYQTKLLSVGIECLVPKEEDFIYLRRCIEGVKQNKYDEDIEGIFVDFINRSNACILGCTELPILYERCKNMITTENIYDPIYIALKKIKSEYEQM